MGCNCGGKKALQPQAVASTTRNTFYQVLDTNRTTVAEFSTIQEARTKAQEIGGIVRVSSKSMNG